MPGWLNSAGSGRLTSMRSNATSIACETIARIPTANLFQRMDHQPPPKGNSESGAAAPTAKARKEIQDENQSNERVRGRPGKSPAFLYRRPGFCQEDRFQPGSISLADRGLARRAGGHRTAARA